jgi:hypothetical protein
MNWQIKKEIWRYWNVDKKFMVEVHKWEEHGKVHWNKYLYLYPGQSYFLKYRPTTEKVFPETPWDWNYGVTFYDEKIDKDSGEIKYQQFGDDYNHIWYEEKPVDSNGTRVFEDAEKLIKSLEAQ